MQTLATRFCDFIARRRVLVLCLFLAHLVFAHYVWLGYTTWDGMSYRVPLIVELIQHGELGGAKYPHWSLHAFRPFLELVNLPFLYVFGLPGLYLSATLVLFPLCLVSVYLLGRELFGDERCGLFGAMAYALVPMVNEQIISGYTDFAVVGLLALFVFSILRLRHSTSAWSYVLLAAATVLYTMARQQAPYLAIFYFAILAGVIFFRIEGRRLRVRDALRLKLATVALVVGLAPAAATHIWRFFKYGNPIYPYEFSVLGLKIGTNFHESYRDSCTNGGMREFSPFGFLEAFKSGWIWPRNWPKQFSDSRDLGGGLFLIIALALLPFLRRRLNRMTWIVLGVFLFASLAVRDFWLPRYSYGLVLSVALLTGAGIHFLSQQAGKKIAFWAVTVLVLLHVGRPEWEAFSVPPREFFARMDLAGSRHFTPGFGAIRPLPDMNAKLVLVEVWNGFYLQLFGARLTNQVLGTVPAGEPEKICERIASYGKEAIFVDDGKRSAACPRECVWPTEGRCRLFRLKEQQP